MKDQKISRRSLLKWMGASTAVMGLAACAPAPSSSSSSTASTSEGAAPDSAKKQMSIATYAIVFHEWQRHFAREWAAENPDVELDIQEIVYADMPKLQLTMLATDTLWDVLFSGIKWYPYSALSGAFLPLDDHIASTDNNIEDFFDSAMESSRVDGVTYGLPYEMHPGNPALIIYNKTMLDEKGLEYPQDDWDVMRYAELTAAAADVENGIFGTSYMPGNYYDFSNLCRSFGTEIFGDEGREFLFNVAPESIEAARWVWSLRNELRVAPNRDESQGLLFNTGTLATAPIGLYAVLQQKDDIGDKFEYDFALHPLGPRGQRAYNAFVSIFSAYSGTNHPDQAFDLINYLLRTESGIWVMQNPPSYPIPRRTVWESPEVSALPSIFQRALDMMTDPSIPGPFAMPYNVRFQEFQDTWANTTPDLFHGDIDFETQMQFVQDECQAILDLPRPT